MREITAYLGTLKSLPGQIQLRSPALAIAALGCQMSLAALAAGQGAGNLSSLQAAPAALSAQVSGLFQKSRDEPCRRDGRRRLQGLAGLGSRQDRGPAALQDLLEKLPRRGLRIDP